MASKPPYKRTIKILLGSVITLTTLTLLAVSCTHSIPPQPSPPPPQVTPAKPNVQKPATPKPAAQPATANNLLLGNPSNATANATNADNYLIAKPQYVMSYNNSKRIPNWVSWQLNQSWLGTTDRKNDFRPDDSLPAGWYKVRPNDYTGSGYDRGHMAPSADRTRSQTDNSATFLMSNIVPQAPENNQGPWGDLEEYSRELVRQGKELYIVAGTVGTKATIGKNQKITVPAKTWKVIVVLDKPGIGLKGLTTNTRTIAVEMPNDASVKGKSWKSFRVPIRQVEKQTGLNFLSNVSPQIQQVIESKADTR